VLEPGIRLGGLSSSQWNLEPDIHLCSPAQPVASGALDRHPPMSMLVGRLQVFKYLAEAGPDAAQATPLSGTSQPQCASL
jgi:hypothetical protein